VQPRQQNVEGSAIDTLHPLRRPKEEQVAEEKAGTGQRVAVSAADAAAAIASAIPTRTGTPTAPTVPPLRILLTDDTPSILKVVGRLLRSNGHTVETAVNGIKSLEMLKAAYEKGECDLLLTDLQVRVLLQMHPFLFCVRCA
jgi:PleD family two-component response regulator